MQVSQFWKDFQNLKFFCNFGLRWFFDEVDVKIVVFAIFIWVVSFDDSNFRDFGIVNVEISIFAILVESLVNVMLILHFKEDF